MSRLIHLPEWEALRTIGQSRIVSLTMLAPFVGYLIIFNHGVVDFLELSLDAIGFNNRTGYSSQPNLSRLRQLYLGLTLIGAASVIFKWRCPSVIQRHHNRYEFVNAEIKIMTDERFADIQRVLSNIRAQTPDFWDGKIQAICDVSLTKHRQQMAGSHPLSWEGWIAENRANIIEAVSTLYGAMNQTRVWSRFSIVLLYSIGFGFLAWSSLLVFGKVFYVTIMPGR